MNKLIFSLMTISLLALPAGTAPAAGNPAHCTVDGVLYICPSKQIEHDAVALAISCWRLDIKTVISAVHSLQVNEGPYDDARQLAADAAMVNGEHKCADRIRRPR